MIAVEDVDVIEPERDRPAQTDRINIGADTVTRHTKDLPERQQYLIRWLYGHAMDREWGWTECAAQSLISTTTLFRVWNGTYRETIRNKDGSTEYRPIGLESLCEKIERCKNLCEQREALRRLPFIETRIWRDINKVCEETRLMQIMSFIYGESQIGKTACLEEYERRNNSGRTVYVRAPSCGGVQTLMKEIAKACHVSPKSSFDGLKGRVFKAFDHSKLLCVDEVHLFFETYQRTSVLRCLETLRELHDRTGTGVVLCGTEVFKQELRSGEYSKMLKQFFRRGIYELQLPAIAPRGDLEAIAAAYGLPKPAGEALELVLLIAKNHGLGKFIKLLAKSNQMARKKGEKAGWGHFIRAHDIIAKMAVLGEGE